MHTQCSSIFIQIWSYEGRSKLDIGHRRVCMLPNATCPHMPHAKCKGILLYDCLGDANQLLYPFVVGRNVVLPYAVICWFDSIYDATDSLCWTSFAFVWCNCWDFEAKRWKSSNFIQMVGSAESHRINSVCIGHPIHFFLWSNAIRKIVYQKRYFMWDAFSCYWTPWPQMRASIIHSTERINNTIDISD